MSRPALLVEAWRPHDKWITERHPTFGPAWAPGSPPPAGRPQGGSPLVQCGGLTVGLSLLARPGEDERLLAAARLV